MGLIEGKVRSSYLGLLGHRVTYLKEGSFKSCGKERDLISLAFHIKLLCIQHNCGVCGPLLQKSYVEALVPKKKALNKTCFATGALCTESHRMICLTF